MVEKDLVDKATQAAVKTGEVADKAKETLGKTGDAVNQTTEVVTKTWPDVTSQALDGIKAGLGDVAKVVQDISTELAESAPHIWRGLVAYHRGIAIGELIVTMIWIIAGIILIFLGKNNFSKAWAEGHNNHMKERQWPSTIQFKVAIGIAMMVFGSIIQIFCINFLPEEIGDVIVPERKAAIEIISSIKDGGKIPTR